MTQLLANPDAIDIANMTDVDLADHLDYCRGKQRQFTNLNLVNPCCGYDDAVAEYRDAAEALQAEIDRRKG